MDDEEEIAKELYEMFGDNRSWEALPRADRDRWKGEAERVVSAVSRLQGVSCQECIIGGR